MRRIVLNVFALVLSALVAFVPAARADVTNQPPDFNEVFDLIRSHLPGTTEVELNAAAVDGLIAQLHGKVSIAGRENTDGATNAALASHADVLDDGVAYVRVQRVANGLADQLRAAWQRLSSTNKLKGLALDLRFAGGHDYAAAVAAADLFISKEQTLLDWGDGTARSKAKTDAIAVPVAVLVNRQTSGAAEALAAVLRETSVGLILGNTTAGAAMVAHEYPLKNGQRLLIAAQPVKQGDGSALSAQGVRPDIQVAVSPEADRAYFEDAFAVITNAGAVSLATDANRAAETNRAPRRARISEADLVRERRQGSTNMDELAARAEREQARPIIRDPVLSRAVDLLKGLAVVRDARF